MICKLKLWKFQILLKKFSEIKKKTLQIVKNGPLLSRIKAENYHWCNFKTFITNYGLRFWIFLNSLEEFFKTRKFSLKMSKKFAYRCLSQHHLTNFYSKSSLIRIYFSDYMQIEGALQLAAAHLDGSQLNGYGQMWSGQSWHGQ